MGQVQSILDRLSCQRF
uniref:Uncharacterized protein n=1 Tax=Rhizophora mucronata TaxID=61149 RepID=A0A2P2Q0F2_RHIMU